MHQLAQTVLATAVVATLAASPIATASGPELPLTLESGFRLDPWKREVVAGGPNWDDCWQLPDEPQFVIEYESGGYALSFGTLGHGLDTTLQVTTPMGDFLCDNNSGGDHDALITLGQPTSGRYEVRVGTFWPDDVGSIAEAYVTERIAAGPIKPTPLHQWNLEAGFDQDPRHAEVVVGGPIQDGCGHLPDEPSLVFDYESGNHALSVGTIGFRLNTTLMVATPEGDVLCDDDGGDYRNALITLPDPPSGRYEVRVGTTSADDVGSIAEVYVTERIDDRPVKPVPVHQWTLEDGFGPDPLNALVSAGGPTSGECGHLPDRPQVVVDYEGGGSSLGFGAAGYWIARTSLQVTTPAGDVLCDRDYDDARIALIVLGDPANGRYEVRVGSNYSGVVGRVARVFVTERVHPGAIKPAPVHRLTFDAAFGLNRSSAGVTAGGLTRDDCGHLPNEPQLVLDYEHGYYALSLGALGHEFDATLQVTTPTGDVLCDDDSGAGRDARIVLRDPASGRYEIRVGTSSIDAVGRNAEVLVTEFDSDVAVIEATDCHGWETEGFFGTSTVEDVRQCVEAGAELDARDVLGNTPLHLAVGEGANPDVVQVLLDAGADPNARNDYDVTPLHVAPGTGTRPEVVRMLLSAGADPNALDRHGLTPLHLAAGGEAGPEAVQLLLDAGADPNAQAYLGLTALHWAVREDTIPDVVQALLAAGADPNLPDTEGVTPLHRAAGFDTSPEAVRALLSARADPNAPDVRGLTPLHWAAGRGTSAAMVQALLDAGADPDSRDRNGKLPIDLIPEDSLLRGTKVYHELRESHDR